jgi:glycine oxidase
MNVAIIGAGLIGSSIAWRLAQSGVNVALFDAGSFGGETSSAGAGMLSPGGEFDEPSRWLDLGVESMRMYPDFVGELHSETGLPIDFQIVGSEYLVDSAHVQARVAFQSSQGISVEVRPGGLFYPTDAFVDPTDLLRALRKACQTRGVHVTENHPLSAVESTDHDAVVIAAGAWSQQICVTHRGNSIDLPPVKPIKGHLIGFDLKPGFLGHMRRRGHTYLLQRSNGFTLAGSTEEDAGFDRTVNSATCEEIHRDAARLFPAIEPIAPSKRWIGFRPFSPAGPHIGRVDNSNVFLAYGHYRNGILLAPLTAQRIASAIANK